MKHDNVLAVSYEMYEFVKVEAERHHGRDVIVLEVPKDSSIHEPTPPMQTILE